MITSPLSGSKGTPDLTRMVGRRLGMALGKCQQVVNDGAALE
ncbi:hypothetical protein [Streptomyces sp. NPDC021622]